MRVIKLFLVFCVVSIMFLENAAAIETNPTLNIASNTSDFTIESQIMINGVNVGEKGIRIIDGDTLNAVFSVTNNTESEKSFSVMLATYSEDKKLYNVEEGKTDIGAGESKNIEMLYQFDAEYEQLGKIFFWSPLNGVSPVRVDINFSQSSGINAYYYDNDNRMVKIDKINGTSIVFTYDNMGNMLTKAITE